jgi:hypothetical protein
VTESESYTAALSWFREIRRVEIIVTFARESRSSTYQLKFILQHNMKAQRENIGLISALDGGW